MTSTRITIDVTFDPDAVIVDVAYRHNDIAPIEVLGALDMARQQILNEATS